MSKTFVMVVLALLGLLQLRYCYALIGHLYEGVSGDMAVVLVMVLVMSLVVLSLLVYTIYLLYRK